MRVSSTYRRTTALLGQDAKPLTDFVTSAGTLLESFEDATDWTSFGGLNGTPTFETSSLHTKAGSFSMHWSQASATAGRKIARYASLSADLSHDFLLDLWLHWPATPASGTRIEVWFGSDTPGTFTNYAYAILGSAHTNFRAGNQSVRLPKDIFTNTGGSIDWAAVAQIMIKFKTDDADEEVYMDALYEGRTARPKVLITMDDGIDTQLAAVTEANDSKIPITLYIIPAQLDLADRLTTANVATLAAAGNAICAHGADAQPTLAQWDANTALLKANGYESQFGAWPNGQAPDASITIAQSAGIISCRALRGGLNNISTYSYENTTLGCADFMRLNAVNLNNSMSLADAKAHVDEAIEYGETIIFYSHGFEAAAGANDWATADFTALIAHIKRKEQAGLIDAETHPGWYRGQQ